MLEKHHLETAHIALKQCLEREQSLTAKVRIHVAYVAVSKELDYCPICHERPKDTTTRKDPKGQHWCKECLTEFDNIDWEEVVNRERE